jgi:ribonuclease J
MKIKIYKGTKEIGGTCVELTADNDKILWIDLGMPLEDKNSNIDYIQNKLDALLISHPHQDHFGLMDRISAETPVYIGQISLNLINATRIFRRLEEQKGNFQIITSWKSFKIEDTFIVKPYLMDHSTPEAFAFLIEADGTRIFYSGDFRATGNKSIVYKRLLNNPPENIDLLLMEGTMVERTNNLFPDELSVKQKFIEIIKEQKNASFVISSAQNIDRFVSVFKACKIAKKKLVIDVYTAWVLDVIKYECSRTPDMTWNEIKVFNHPSQLESIKSIANKEFIEKVKKNNVSNDVFRHPADYVYFVRFPSEKLINTLRNQGKINIIYSQWEGYLEEEHKTYCTDYLNILKNDSDIVFHTIHTSGHATVDGLIGIAKAMKPKKIAPIHTSYPETFKKVFEKEGFENVELWDDGVEYEL